jgi:hypothetical protein
MAHFGASALAARALGCSHIVKREKALLLPFDLRTWGIGGAFHFGERRMDNVTLIRVVAGILAVVVVVILAFRMKKKAPR